jgi:hypothetical protein
MRVSPLIFICLAAMAGLGGCKRADNGDASWLSGIATKHGRYLGVGIYSPGLAWQQLVTRQTSGDPAVARLVDDQAIFVLEDSDTGEVRACGDLSRYCISANPWKQALVVSEPVSLNRPTEEVAPSARSVRRRPYRPASSPRSPPAAAPAES